MTFYSADTGYYLTLSHGEEVERTIEIPSNYVDIEAIEQDVRANWQEYANGRQLVTYQADLTVSGTATVGADTETEARQLIAESVVGEEATLTLDGVEVAVRFDEASDCELGGMQQ